MQILEDETCQQCGNPIWVCRNEFAHNVGFKVKEAKCYATAELEKWQEKEEKKNSKKKKYGTYPYTVPYTYDGSEMPSRLDFYRSLAEQHKVE
jgi:hypothetical protein